MSSIVNKVDPANVDSSSQAFANASSGPVHQFDPNTGEELLVPKTNLSKKGRFKIPKDATPYQKGWLKSFRDQASPAPKRKLAQADTIEISPEMAKPVPEKPFAGHWENGFTWDRDVPVVKEDTIVNDSSVFNHEHPNLAAINRYLPMTKPIHDLFDPTSSKRVRDLANGTTSEKEHKDRVLRYLKSVFNKNGTYLGRYPSQSTPSTFQGWVVDKGVNGKVLDIHRPRTQAPVLKPFRDIDATRVHPPKDWSLSREAKNKETYALLGNPPKGKKKVAITKHQLGRIEKEIKQVAPKKLSGNGPRSQKALSSVRWSHKELVRNLESSEEFVPLSIPINFRNASLFPFARRLADNFDRYKIHNLTVHYETTSGPYNATSPALGSVYLAISYDPDDTEPTTEEEFSTIDYWKSTAPQYNLSLSMSSNRNKLYFLRGGDGSTSSDPRLEDPGVLHIGTVGGPSSVYQCGKIWVSYDVEFLNPRLTSVPSKGTYSLTHCLNCVTASPFGAAATDRTLATSSDFAPTVTNASGSTIFVLPVKGRFLVYVNFDAGTSCTLSGTVPAVYGNAVFASVLINAADGGRGNNVWGSASADAGYAFCIDVPDTLSGFRIYDPTLVSAGTNAADVLIVGVASDIDVDIIKGMTSRMIKLKADLRSLECELKDAVDTKLVLYENKALTSKKTIVVNQDEEESDGPVLIATGTRSSSSSSSNIRRSK